MSNAPNNSELIKKYAEGYEIECFCRGWNSWMNLNEMRDSAIRTFLGIENDPDWEFRVKQEFIPE